MLRCIVSVAYHLVENYRGNLKLHFSFLFVWVWFFFFYLEKFTSSNPNCPSIGLKYSAVRKLTQRFMPVLECDLQLLT